MLYIWFDFTLPVLLTIALTVISPCITDNYIPLSCLKISFLLSSHVFKFAHGRENMWLLFSWVCFILSHMLHNPLIFTVMRKFWSFDLFDHSNTPLCAILEFWQEFLGAMLIYILTSSVQMFLYPFSNKCLLFFFS